MNWHLSRRLDVNLSFTNQLVLMLFLPWCLHAYITGYKVKKIRAACIWTYFLIWRRFQDFNQTADHWQRLYEGLSRNRMIFQCAALNDKLNKHVYILRFQWNGSGGDVLLYPVSLRGVASWVRYLWVPRAALISIRPPFLSHLPLGRSSRSPRNITTFRIYLIGLFLWLIYEGPKLLQKLWKMWVRIGVTYG